MFGWIWRGLRTGIVTTRYPARPEPQPDGVRNLLVLDASSVQRADAERYVAVCPTGAITATDSEFRLDLGRCIQCGRCVDLGINGMFRFTSQYEVATRSRADLLTRIPIE
jgi:formate hydrogenlyase subunit 6/NADH:ubiquinone oxidoreductase subunit I